MKIVPSYIVHALVTSLYTTYIFRGFVKKSIATITIIDPRRTNLNFVGLGPLPVPQLPASASLSLTVKNLHRERDRERERDNFY